MRPEQHEYFLILAKIASMRSSCIRRMVGCILVDENNHILSIGYNGPPAGFPNCTENPCEGAIEAVSGQNLDSCRAVHAEANAIIQCLDIRRIHAAYLTVSPCRECIKLLLSTPCKKLYFLETYNHADSLELWTESGRTYSEMAITKRTAKFVAGEIYRAGLRNLRS